MKNKKLLAMLLAVVVLLAMMPGMAFADELMISAAPTKSNDIVILTTNDVHCGMSKNIGYAGLASYKKEMQEKYNYVALVDAGDAIQGESVGTLSKGTYLIDIMNKVGYDIQVPGNHEFDYGMDQFLEKIVPASKAPYVSANFVKEGKPVFEPYKILSYGTKKVAFVGVCTPETFTKSTPTYFQDDKGNYIYGFCQGNDGKDLYDAVQKAVDSAKKEGADFIIAVGHLGDDEASNPWTSQDVIKNTTGIDAFVDGHAHSTFASVVKNKEGKNVATVSTGTKLENIGKVVISESGVVTTALVTAAEATTKDAEIESFINEIEKKYEALVNKVVAKTDVVLAIADENGNRQVRSQETNLGDLCADAYKNVLGADIAFVNGGGIRVAIDKGDITYGEILNVHPFGNVGCVIEVTGQQILDALELGAENVGVGESGGFLQVAGLTYEINPFISSSVVKNEENEFVKVAGDYKVGNVMVAGEALDLTKTYTLASHNYMLKQGGDGFTMFKGSKILQDEVMIDNQILITYIQENLKGKVGSEYAAPQGRIKIATAEEVIIPLVTELEETKEKLGISEYTCKVKATAQKKAVKLTWNACKVNDVKYQVYRSAKKTTGFKRVITTSKTTYTCKKLTTGKTYYFKVRAYKKIGGKSYYGRYSTVVSKKAA